jgi:hypothetical protein
MEEKNPAADKNRVEFSAEESARARRGARLNALILAAVLLVSMVAPSPWNLYAPLLFLIPLLAAIVSRFRRHYPDPAHPDYGSMTILSPGTDPYSYTPKDPKDPRRYKPIG